MNSSRSQIDISSFDPRASSSGDSTGGFDSISFHTPGFATDRFKWFTSQCRVALRTRNCNNTVGTERVRERRKSHTRIFTCVRSRRVDIMDLHATTLTVSMRMTNWCVFCVSLFETHCVDAVQWKHRESKLFAGYSRLLIVVSSIWCSISDLFEFQTFLRQSAPVWRNEIENENFDCERNGLCVMT